MRFKYHPDGVIYIGGYWDTYANFLTDCAALEITDTFDEGLYFEYIPTRTPKLDYINSQGHHLPQTNRSLAKYQAVLDRESDFIAQYVIRNTPEPEPEPTPE